MKDQADLFRPFHRAQGLHGEVMLASYPNEGTTFTVDLPADSGS